MASLKLWAKLATLAVAIQLAAFVDDKWGYHAGLSEGRKFITHLIALYFTQAFFFFVIIVALIDRISRRQDDFDKPR